MGPFVGESEKPPVEKDWPNGFRGGERNFFKESLLREPRRQKAILRGYLGRFEDRKTRQRAAEGACWGSG
jgi:hypothetical protein